MISSSQSIVSLVYCRKISAYGVSLVSVTIVFQHLPCNVTALLPIPLTLKFSKRLKVVARILSKTLGLTGNTPDDKCFYISSAFGFAFMKIYLQPHPHVQISYFVEFSPYSVQPSIYGNFHFGSRFLPINNSSKRKNFSHSFEKFIFYKN